MHGSARADIGCFMEAVPLHVVISQQDCLAVRHASRPCYQFCRRIHALPHVHGVFVLLAAVLGYLSLFLLDEGMRSWTGALCLLVTLLNHLPTLLLLKLGVARLVLRSFEFWFLSGNLLVAAVAWVSYTQDAGRICTMLAGYLAATLALLLDAILVHDEACAVREGNVNMHAADFGSNSDKLSSSNAVSSLRGQRHRGIIALAPSLINAITLLLVVYLDAMPDINLLVASLWKTSYSNKQIMLGGLANFVLFSCNNFMKFVLRPNELILVKAAVRLNYFHRRRERKEASNAQLLAKSQCEVIHSELEPASSSWASQVQLRNEHLHEAITFEDCLAYRYSPDRLFEFVFGFYRRPAVEGLLNVVFSVLMSLIAMEVIPPRYGWFSVLIIFCMVCIDFILFGLFNLRIIKFVPRAFEFWYMICNLIVVLVCGFTYFIPSTALLMIPFINPTVIYLLYDARPGYDVVTEQAYLRRPIGVTMPLCIGYITVYILTYLDVLPDVQIRDISFWNTSFTNKQLFLNAVFTLTLFLWKNLGKFLLNNANMYIVKACVRVIIPPTLPPAAPQVVL